MGTSVTDDQERIVAGAIELRYPQWVVMWGCYTRLFWALPRFGVPRGTFVSARRPESLIADMLGVEIEFGARPPLTSYKSLAPAAQLPRRVPLALRMGPRPSQPVPVALPPAQRRQVRTNYDPYISGPLNPDGFDPDQYDWDSSGASGQTMRRPPEPATGNRHAWAMPALLDTSARQAAYSTNTTRTSRAEER
jgi:hypothetical protein